MSTKDWKAFRLDEIAVVQGGGTPRRSETSYFGGSIPWVTPSDLPAIGLITKLHRTKETITKAGLDSSSAKIIEPGSVLFSSRASVGKIAVTDGQCATNQGFTNFTPHRDKVDHWFLAFLLCRFTPNITALAGKTTFLEVPRGKLKAFKAKLPPLNEQLRIVARIKECMERVEEIEALRTESCNECSMVLRAYYHDLYRGLVQRYTTMPLVDAGIAKGGGTPSKKRNDFWNGDIPWISPREMKRRDLFNATQKITEAAIAGSSTRLIKEPSVLFVVRGMILSHTLPVAVNRVPVTINQDMKAITPRVNIKVDFLAAMLRGSEHDLLSKVEVAGHGTRRLQTVHWSMLPVPIVSEQDQTAIVSEVQNMEAVADALKRDVELDEIQLVRESILRKAFAGEL